MTSLSSKARVAGLLYIVASAVGVVRLIYIPTKLFVHGNAAATAANIASHDLLFRVGIVSYLLAGVLWLFVPLALYRLLKAVDHTLAVMMVILGSLMQVPAYIINVGTDGAALLLVRGAGYLSTFGKPQREAFAMLSLNIHHELDLANMIFAGLWLIPFGLLVYRSHFLPRILGAWLMLESVAWVALSVVGLLFPGQGYEDKVFTYGQPLMFAEVAIMLWLLIMGARDRGSTQLVPQRQYTE
ncbi:MAG TPA: DUF4386 domain-containing protein [Thermoanaerobaculia bacterium]